MKTVSLMSFRILVDVLSNYCPLLLYWNSKELLGKSPENESWKWLPLKLSANIAIHLHKRLSQHWVIAWSSLIFKLLPKFLLDLEVTLGSVFKMKKSISLGRCLLWTTFFSPEKKNTHTKNKEKDVIWPLHCKLKSHLLSEVKWVRQDNSSQF